MKRIQIVDLVRTVAILTVLSHHLGFHYIVQASASPFLAWAWYKIWVNGGFGVTIFFVVSGFVITRLIASQDPPHGLFNPDLREFYTRRVGRILPLLTLTCIAGIIMISFFPNPSHPFEYCFKNPKAFFNVSFWLSIMTFTFYWYKILWHSAAADYGLHWDLLWSLSVEEQFYFFYPFLLKKLGRERNLRLFLVVLVFFPPVFGALRSFYFPHTTIPVVGNLGPFAAIAMGCLLYLATERFKNYLSGNKIMAFLLCGFGLAIFLKAYLHQDFKADILGHLFGDAFITWGVFFFLLGGLHLDFFNSKLWAPLARPGVLSYGGYLIHPTLLYFLWPLMAGKNEYFAILIFILGTFSVAQLSHQFYEMPVNLWVRRVLGRPHLIKGA